jgi:hypothetical protein
MKDRIFENALNVIRRYLKEEGGAVGGIANVTNKSGGPITIAGLPPYSSTNSPPVDLRKKKYSKLPGPYKDLFRRTNSAQPKYPS